MLGAKLTDGNFLCGDCVSKAAYTSGFLSYIEMNTKKSVNELTLEEYKEMLALREKNLEELKEFNATTSLESVQIDEDLQEIVSIDKLIYENKDKLYEANPPVFKMENLAFAKITASKPESSTTLTGKAKAECNVYLVAGFEDPVYDVSRVQIGKYEVKDGFFGYKEKESPDIKKLTDAMVPMMEWEMIRESGEDEPLTPAQSMDSYFTMLKRARDRKFIDKDDVTEVLKMFYGRDRALIKEVRKMYGL